MKRRLSAQRAFVNLRAPITLLVCGAAACSMLSGVLLAFFRPEAPANSSQRTLTFAERVAYQRAIEEVYWRHRIWPKANAGPKPPLEKVMSHAEIEKKLEDYLRNSQALEDYLQWAIAPDQLQAEMERIASHTKQPGVLRELFEALGCDPFVIAECLARPVLTERLVVDLSTQHTTRRVEPARTKALCTMSMAATLANAAYTLPKISEGGPPCTDDSWTATTITNAPDGRINSAAVWTGSEMIVWGGTDESNEFNTGGRYNPSTDSWTATSITNAPTGRELYTAIWTGSEMILWGGAGATSYLNTGGRYNPSTDSWTATGTTGAPAGRYDHTAVWTGSEMIVWGGIAGGPTYFNTGGRYNPNTDSWTATTTTNAPAARYLHTAIWTSTEMIIWGGVNVSSLNTGGRYDPSTDSWTATSTTNAPTARSNPLAVWSGRQMVVWSGVDLAGNYLNTGGRYCAAAPSPTPTPTSTPSPTASATATPTPCTGRCAPTPRLRPTPVPRP